MREGLARHIKLESGALFRSTLEEHIRNSLRATILTHQGERPLYPELGSRVRDSLFRPLTSETLADIQTEVRSAIARCEPRVELQLVEINPDDTDRSRLIIHLKYRIRETRKVDQVKIAVRP
jgi:uncharacterized protein